MFTQNMTPDNLNFRGDLRKFCALFPHCSPRCKLVFVQAVNLKFILYKGYRGTLKVFRDGQSMGRLMKLYW